MGIWGENVKVEGGMIGGVEQGSDDGGSVDCKPKALRVGQGSAPENGRSACVVLVALADYATTLLLLCGRFMHGKR